MSTRRKVIPILIILMSFFGLFSIDNTYAMDTKTISNVVVFTKFKDDTRDIFNAKTSSSDNWTLIKNIYNKNESNGEDNSFKNYIKIISEGNLEVNNYFPQESSDEKSVATYTLNNNASYYQNSDLIIQEVINAINDSKISYSLDSNNLSNMNSGFIDNLTIIVQGSPDDSNAIASHKAEYSGTETINGLRVSNYNIIPSSYVVTDDATMGARQAQSIIAHEFLHVLGLPDLYRKTDSGEPVGMWDIMGKSSFYLQYPLSYLRLKQGWITSNTITKSGSYTLTAVSEKGGNKLFEIKTPLSNSESIFLEYRKKNNSTYALDHGIPSSGLLMYRVDNKVEDYTNIRGKNYIYVYRPNVTDKDSGSDIASDGEYKGFNRYYDAALEPEKGENEYGSTDLTKTFQDNTLYYSDGKNSGIKISNVTYSSDKNEITFNVDFANYNEENLWKNIDSLAANSYGSILYKNKASNEVYISYSNGSGSTSKVSVKKIKGNSLDVIGNEIDNANYPSLAVYNNSLYLVTQRFNGYLDLYKLEGSSWKKIKEYKTNYPKNVKLIESNKSLYLMYEETVSGYKTKLTINDVVNNKVITEREAQDFGNPAVSFYNNKLYLAYSSYFDSNSSAKIESYDLEKNEWKVEKTSTINKSNVHYIKQYGNKLYVLIGADKTSPIVYTYDGTTWSEDKINLINNYSNLTMNIINDNVYLSYINTQDNKTNLLKLSNHKSEIIDSNLGSDYSYLYTENDKENMYAITSDNNSTSINIKTKKIETDNSNNSTDDKGNDNNKDNNKENEGTDQSKNGFVVENGNTYYYVNGKKLTGRNKIDGIEYYFDEAGIMHGNILFLGDSLTDYYNLSKYYQDELVINSGIAGNTTDDILNDMYNRVYKYNPSKVILLIGTNDIAHGKDVEYIVNNINKIINLIREKLPNCKIYLESLYPINNTNNSKIDHNMVANRTNKIINQINAKINKIQNTTYINVHDSLIDTNGNLNINYTIEGLHINNNGYERITKIIKPYLDEPDGSSNVINGWYYENGNTYYYIDGKMQKGVTKIGNNSYFLGENTGKLITGWVTSSINGKVYYSEADGKLKKGFSTISGIKYYFSTEDNSMQKGVTKIGNDSYFLGENTGKVITGWVTSSINGKVYYSESDGKLKKGFSTISGIKYYFSPEDNSMQKGVTKIGNDSYFLGENTGKVITGWVTSSINGKVYYSESDGKLKKGLTEINGEIYYFNDDGSGYTGFKYLESKKNTYYFVNSYLKKGITTINGNDYFLGEITGKVCYGWITSSIDGRTYHTNDKGIIEKGIINVDDKYYFLGEITGKLCYGWITSSITHKIYYAGTDGVLQKGTININNEYYRFGDDYSLQSGWQNINNATYYFYADGTRAENICKIAGVRYEFSSTGELQHSNIKIIADISKYQGKINWDQLWASGEIDGVILRIGYSLGMDSKFIENLREVKRLGIPYTVYHFSTAENAYEAQLEANHLINWYRENNLTPFMDVYYDIESWYNSSDGHTSDAITVESYDSIISTYKAALNNAGIGMGVYTGKDYAERRLSDYGRQQVSWIAHYATDCGYKGSYRGWQYTSKAVLPGITENTVDLSIFYW